MEFLIKLFVIFVTFFALYDASPILNTFGNHGSSSPGRNLAFRNDKNDASFEQPDNWKSRHVYQKPMYLDPHGDFDKSDDNINHEVPSAIDYSSDGLIIADDRNNIQMRPLYNSDPSLNLKVQAQPDNSIEDQKAINIYIHNNEIAHNSKEDNIQNVKGLNENDLNAISNTRTKKSARVVQELVAPQDEQSKKSPNKKVKGKKSKVPIPDSNVVLVKTNVNDIRSDERILHQDSQQNLYSSPNEFYYKEKPNINHVKPIKSKALSSGGVHYNKNPHSSRIYPLYIGGNVDQPYNFVENQEVVVPNDHKKQHGPDKNIAHTPKASKAKGYLYTNPNMINSVVNEPQSKHSNKKDKGKKSIGDSEVSNYSDYIIKSSNDKAFDERSGNLKKNLYTSPHQIDYSQNNPHNINYQNQQAGNLYPLYNIDTHALYNSVPVNNKNLQPDNFVQDQKINKHLLLDQTINNIGPRHNYMNEKVDDSKSVVFEKQKKKDKSGRKILIPITEKKFFYQAQPVLPEPDRNNEETIYYIN